MNDVTHLGIYDIPLISNIPNMVYLAPTNKQEYFAMLDWSIEQDQYPVAIRIPCNGVISTTEDVDTDYSDLNKYQIKISGSNIAILALGDFFDIGEKLAKAVLEKTGVMPTLINPRYITGLDVYKRQPCIYGIMREMTLLCMESGRNRKRTWRKSE